MFYFVIESLRSYNYSNTPDLQKNFLFYRNLSTHLNIFDDIFNVLFLYSWSSWQKNSKLPQNNLYTWKSSNRHLYWSSLCKKSDVRYLSSHSLNQELFKRHKSPFPRFFESLDESLKLSSWIIQSYCRQNRYKSFWIFYRCKYHPRIMKLELQSAANFLVHLIR